jgi:hypothetical protein
LLPITLITLHCKRPSASKRERREVHDFYEGQQGFVDEFGAFCCRSAFNYLTVGFPSIERLDILRRLHVLIVFTFTRSASIVALTIVGQCANDRPTRPSAPTKDAPHHEIQHLERDSKGTLSVRSANTEVMRATQSTLLHPGERLSLQRRVVHCYCGHLPKRNKDEIGEEARNGIDTSLQPQRIVGDPVQRPNRCYVIMCLNSCLLQLIHGCDSRMIRVRVSSHGVTRSLEHLEVATCTSGCKVRRPGYGLRTQQAGTQKPKDCLICMGAGLIRTCAMP